MTNEDAIEILNVCELVPNNNLDLSHINLYDVWDLCREALGYRTSKKPTQEKDCYRCDICGSVVGIIDLRNFNVLKSKYCNECGQAVDWE